MGQHSAFAAQLKRYRVEAGLTQERLAERANLSVRGLSNLERGMDRAPRPETLDRLMDVFSLSPDERALLRAAVRPEEAAADLAPTAPADRASGASGGAASRGLALLREGRAGEGAVEIERACRGTLVAGHLPALAELLAAAAAACLVTAEWDLALAFVERGLPAAERVGDAARIVFLHFLKGCVLFHAGEWGGAQASLERGAGLTVSPGARATAHCPWLGLGVLALARGELDGAARHLDRSLRQAAQHGDASARPYLQAGLAELDLLAARPGAARVRLGALPDLAEQQGLGAFVQVRRAWVQLELGEPAAERSAA